MKKFHGKIINGFQYHVALSVHVLSLLHSGILITRVLLDQLLQYEPVSDEEEEVTDYSTSEDETIDSRTCRPAPSKQVSCN